VDDDLRAAVKAGLRAAGRYELAIPQAVRSGPAGDALGRGTGSSLEFSEHRDYQPGDDLRRIDWSAYARSDRLTVKLHREEITPHLDLLLDASRSMDLPRTPKARVAVALAAGLATTAANAGFSTSLWTAGDVVGRCGTVNQPPPLWDGIDFTGAAPLLDAFRHAPPAWRPRSLRVLISDLLWMDDPSSLLALMGERAAGLAIVQVVAAEDLAPPARGNHRLLDAETGRELDVFIDAGDQRRFAQRLARHREHWRDACRSRGAAFVELTAESIWPEMTLQPLAQAGIVL
jgi:uncharacterized protein (DUF58 family)